MPRASAPAPEPAAGVGWPRIIAWSSVGALAAPIVGGSYVAAYVL